MHEIKDALILCSLLNQLADHIGRIKALWQHPLHPSMTLEAQSGVFAEHAEHGFVQSLSPVRRRLPYLAYNVIS